MTRWAPRFCAWLCAASVAAAAPAARASCFDGVQNGPESDVDCGGDCPPCDIGRTCRGARDCESGLCAGSECQERPYRDGDPVPKGYTVEFSETDSAAKARTIGFLSLGVGYGAAYISALSLPGELSWLYAPVVGPFVVVADESKPKRGLVALDGAIQLVGFTLLVGGIIGGGRRVVRDDDRSEVVELASVAPTIIGERGYGLGMCGTF